MDSESSPCLLGLVPARGRLDKQTDRNAGGNKHLGVCSRAHFTERQTETPRVEQLILIASKPA